MRPSSNSKFPKIKFKSSVMDSTNADGGSDESDGMDDADFLAERQKYVEYYEKRTNDLLKAEEERQNVLPILYGGLLT